jgi:hypothetical protein
VTTVDRTKSNATTVDETIGFNATTVDETKSNATTVDEIKVQCDNCGQKEKEREARRQLEIDRLDGDCNNQREGGHNLSVDRKYDN